MKILFFMAVVIGATYLVLDTGQGQTWLNTYIPTETKEKVGGLAESASSVVKENIANISVKANTEHLQKIKQLEHRIEQLEAQLSSISENAATNIALQSPIEQFETEKPLYSTQVIEGTAVINAVEVKEAKKNIAASRLKAAQLREIFDAMNALSLASLSDL